MDVKVARIGKPHGIRGEVTVQVLTDDPETRFARGARLLTDPEANGPLTVKSARWNKHILLLGFEEVSDRNRAEELRGTMLYVEAEESSDDAWFEHDLVGLEVVVEGETIGKVSALRTGPAQDLLEVTLNDGSEALLPLVEDIIPEIDLDAAKVIATPPPGLLELDSGDQ